MPTIQPHKKEITTSPKAVLPMQTHHTMPGQRGLTEKGGHTKTDHLADEARLNEIDDHAARIRQSLQRKAIASEKVYLAQSIRTLEAKYMRGSVTDDWMTTNITAFCRWGTRTRARQLAWDLYRLHNEMWDILDRG